MPKMSRIALLVLCFALPAAAQAASSVPTAPRKTLTAIASEAEISALFQKWSEEQKRRQEEMRQRRAMSDSMSPPAPSSSAAKPEVQSALGKLAGASADESVTNVQHAGVDEGGIVKVHGDHLVILRRGRLFTVDIRD